MEKHTFKATFTLEVETDDIETVLANFDYLFETGVDESVFTNFELDETELIYK